MFGSTSVVEKIYLSKIYFSADGGCWKLLHARLTELPKGEDLGHVSVRCVTAPEVWIQHIQCGTVLELVPETCQIGIQSKLMSKLTPHAQLGKDCVT